LYTIIHNTVQSMYQTHENSVNISLVEQKNVYYMVINIH